MSRTAIAVVLTLAAVAPATRAQPILNVPSASYPTIQFAINIAANGSVILVAPGTYAESINYAGKAVTVRGSQGAAQTILQGTGGSRVVQFTSGEGSGSILDGFTVQGGNGGILIQNASPVVMNCVVRNNATASSSATTNGGGIRCYATSGGACSPTITSCVLRDNTAAGAGGGFSLSVDSGSASVLVLNNCSFLDNDALGLDPNNKGGGGISVKNSGSSAVTLIGCTVSGNFSRGSGAGLIAEGPSSLQITSCRFVDNVAVPNNFNLSDGQGAGLSVGGTQFTMTNSLVAGNSTPQGGAGLYIGPPWGSSLTSTIRNCTITGNTSTLAAGGGIETNYVSGGQSASLAIVNSIVSGNLPLDLFLLNPPSNYGATIATASYSAVGTGTFTFGPGTILADPLFADPALGDYHLSSASPCRNAGQPGTVGLPGTDLDGSPRIAGGVVDMGSDEVPDAVFPGTNEDLDLLVWVDGAGDPLASSRPAAAAQTLALAFDSLGGTFTGAPPFLVGQVFNTASPPGGTPGFAGVQVNLGLPYTTLYGGLFGPAFPAPGLPAGGVRFFALVPPSVAGNTLRLQGFVITPVAANFLYAATRALEVVF